MEGVRGVGVGVEVRVRMTVAERTTRFQEMILEF